MKSTKCFSPLLTAGVMDITQGSLRKAGVPTPIVKRLRKEANKFYRELLKKKSKCTS